DRRRGGVGRGSRAVRCRDSSCLAPRSPSHRRVRAGALQPPCPRRRRPSASVTVKEYPYWWDTVPALRAGSGQPETPIQNRDVAGRTWDVAIVGAGYTGLAAALRLARTGASVVVLERERAGWGASSRNGGQVLTGAKLDPAVLIARFGETRARELFGIHLDSIAELEALIAGEGIACEYERTGHIQAARKPAHFEAFRGEQALL